MSSQKKTIMGACEFSIASLQNIKAGLMDLGSPHADLNWAIGGIVTTLTSNLLKICDDVFTGAAQSGEPNAKQDLKEIQSRFNEFVDRMVDYE